MSSRAAITKTELRRRIDVLTDAGLQIAAIRPDGTIIVGKASPTDLLKGVEPAQDSPDTALEKWLAHAKN